MRLWVVFDDLRRWLYPPGAIPRRMRNVFNIGQRAAVAGAFKLAGYEGPLSTAPVRREGDDERAFLFSAEDFAALRDVRTLQQLVGQVLGCKVYIVPLNPQWGEPIPFE